MQVTEWLCGGCGKTHGWVCPVYGSPGDRYDIRQIQERKDALGIPLTPYEEEKIAEYVTRRLAGRQVATNVRTFVEVVCDQCGEKGRGSEESNFAIPGGWIEAQLVENDPKLLDLCPKCAKKFLAAQKAPSLLQAARRLVARK